MFILHTKLDLRIDGIWPSLEETQYSTSQVVMGASCEAVVAVIELLAEVVTELTQTETTKTRRRHFGNIEQTKGRWERTKKIFSRYVQVLFSRSIRTCTQNSIQIKSPISAYEPNSVSFFTQSTDNSIR